MTCGGHLVSVRRHVRDLDGVYSAAARRAGFHFESGGWRAELRTASRCRPRHDAGGKVGYHVDGQAG